MVLADTGYWPALANSRDRWHAAALEASRHLNEALVVTWPVATETCHLLLSRLGVQAELRFVKQVSKNVDIHDIGQGHLSLCLRNLIGSQNQWPELHLGRLGRFQDRYPR